jgi:hypothetical protein
MSTALPLAIQYHKNEEDRRRAQIGRMDDIWVVAGFVEDEVLARPFVSPDATPVIVPRMGHVRCNIDDQVWVRKNGGQWWIAGNMSSDAGLTGLILGEPIIVPTFIRNADALSNTWGTPNATVDFASLRTTVTDLDPSMTYLVTADAEAYLTPAVGTTKVAMGVRIGFASDPDSISAVEPFGAGHRNTVPTLAHARFERIVSGVFSIQVTGRGYSSVVGSHTIGDAALHIRLVPMLISGRI